MTPAAWIVVAIVALAALLAMLRAWRHARRHRVALLLLQPLAALALAAALLAPHATGPTRLHVLTEGADAAAASDGPGIRLPGAPAASGVPMWPSLAALLRAHPHATTLVVHGHGLDSADLAALGNCRIAFRPADPPHGFVALDAPGRVQAGARFAIRGRVRTEGDAVVRLLDPAGRSITDAPITADGSFALDALAPVPGRHRFELALLVGDDVRHALPIGVLAGSATPQRGVVLAAAPSAELRALRRWAADAGLELAARIALAPDLAVQGTSLRLDAATLADTDLLILDERSWPARASEREALREAVANGMGLLLRISGPVPASLPDALARLGGDAPAPNGPSPAGLLAGSDGDTPVAVPWTPSDASAAASDLILHAWPVRLAADAAPLLTAPDGRLLGAWRPLGQGRVGVLALADSFRLQARGRPGEYGTLWSGIWARLARATPGAALTVAPPPVQGRRSSVCGGEGELLARHDQDGSALHRDADADDCAAWYPRTPGWHRLEAGGSRYDVHVADPAAFAPLLQERRRTETAARATAAVDPTPSAREWPWQPVLLATWLLLLAVSWRLERRSVSPAS